MLFTRFKVGVWAVALTIGLASVHSEASDLAKEKRWAEQVVDGLITGEAEWLQAGGHEFLGIYTEPSTDKAIGGVIVMHGIGVHPDWSEVVHPLRTRLPDSGWHTLSLQMPVLANEADYKDYAPLFDEVAPRIDAGIAFLESKGVTNIILIGHSLGASMASYYLANHDRPEIRALVMIGATGALFKDPERDVVQSLRKIRKPVLDLSGSDDLPGVLETSARKAEAAKAAGNLQYRQISIQGGNHFMAGKEDELVEAVGRWIQPFGS